MTAAFCGMMPDAAVAAGVQQLPATVDGVAARDVRLERNGNYLSVGMLLDLSALKVGGNRAVLLTPRLVNGNDSIDLPAVGVYGRRRYYYYVRNGRSMLSGKDDEQSFRSSSRPDTLRYTDLIPYSEWMNGSQLTLHRSEWGCCNKLLAEQTGLLGERFMPVETGAPAFFPELVYVRPQAEKLKSRALEGSAYIDFPVDKTAIYPDYRRNTTELGKIRATIDSVRDDSDVTITQVWLKGYASPESPYEHNRELALGRTEALKKYIKNLYHFDGTLIATDYEPEDWEGLRRYVEESTALSHKREILALIDSDREPDNKEWRIKSVYPDDYRYLLENCYPALRHTDYRIAYTVRGYSDVDEIERVMRTRPQKLSLNELYLVAQRYEPGSDGFTEVFETAVRMFPSDETANLNAANAAMRRGDNAAAARYLAKAGDTPEAVYARGALAIREGDIDTARRYLTEARALGVEQAAATLADLDRGLRR